MAAIALGMIALVTVVLAFGFAALVFTISHRPQAHEQPPESPPVEARDEGSAAETMSRVLAEVERLAALKESGVLTAKEFAAQKTKLLEGSQ